MKAVLGSSTSKTISREAFALFKALKVMTDRDATVRSAVTLYISTITTTKRRGREILLLRTGRDTVRFPSLTVYPLK